MGRIGILYHRIARLVGTIHVVVQIQVAIATESIGISVFRLDYKTGKFITGHNGFDRIVSHRVTGFVYDNFIFLPKQEFPGMSQKVKTENIGFRLVFAPPIG